MSGPPRAAAAVSRTDRRLTCTGTFRDRIYIYIQSLVVVGPTKMSYRRCSHCTFRNGSNCFLPLPHENKKDPFPICTGFKFDVVRLLRNRKFTGHHLMKALQPSRLLERIRIRARVSTPASQSKVSAGRRSSRLICVTILTVGKSEVRN